MNRAQPARAEVIYLGSDVITDAPAAGLALPVPLPVVPLELIDPPCVPMPWRAPTPRKRDAFNDGSADA